jgi:hypothetical protein
MAGAPKGNQNALNPHRFKEAVKRALARMEGTVDKGLDALADKLVEEARKGEIWAIQMVADRLDGKPAQTLFAEIEHHNVKASNAEKLSGKLGAVLASRSGPPGAKSAGRTVQ